jgi:drug/metabolite transporter (DMT)-like permease
MERERRTGLLLVLLSAVGYAVLPILVKGVYGGSELEPTDIGLLRFALATPILWVVIYLRRRAPSAAPIPDPSLPWGRLVIMGLLYAGAAFSTFFSLDRIDASLYVVLFYTYPPMVVLLSWLLGERPSRWLLVALVLTIVGVLLTVPDVSAMAGGDWLGIAAAFTNGFLVALLFVTSRRWLRTVRSVSQASGVLIAVTAGLFLLAVPFLGLRLPASAEVWLLVLAIGAFSTAMTVFTANLGIQKLGASPAAIVSTIEPVLSMILAVLLLGEVVGLAQWAGAGLIVSSVVVLQLAPAARVRAVAEPGSL